MAEMLLSVMEDGTIRKLFDSEDRQLFGAVPKRASNVLVAEDGPRYGQFYVDFTALFEDHGFCLLDTFEDYDKAVAAEREWLKQNWILGDG